MLKLAKLPKHFVGDCLITLLFLLTQELSSKQEKNI